MGQLFTRIMPDQAVRQHCSDAHKSQATIICSFFHLSFNVAVANLTMMSSPLPA
jgi:hypothetical protein